MLLCGAKFTSVERARLSCLSSLVSLPSSSRRARTVFRLLNTEWSPSGDFPTAAFSSSPNSSSFMRSAALRAEPFTAWSFSAASTDPPPRVGVCMRSMCACTCRGERATTSMSKGGGSREGSLAVANVSQFTTKKLPGRTTSTNTTSRARVACLSFASRVWNRKLRASPSARQRRARK